MINLCCLIHLQALSYNLQQGKQNKRHKNRGQEGHQEKSERRKIQTFTFRVINANYTSIFNPFSALDIFSV